MMRTPAWWQSRGLFSTLLLPLSWAYGLGAFIDRRCAAPRRAPLPVIGIGNATAGGSGKTPTAIALVKLLQEMGETPHLLSRGYGGNHRAAHRVQPTDTAMDVGDEALLLARAAPTWVGSNRWISACVAAEAGATVLVADDALQHHALHKDLNLLVVDAAYQFGNRRLLPAGPLREPLASAMARSDLAVVIGGTAPAMAGWKKPIINAALAPVGDVSFLQQSRWLAFAGIAHPEKFFALLRALGAVVDETVSFADHEPLDLKLAQLKQRAAEKNLQLITTEKDFMRLMPALRDGVATLPVALQWHDSDGLKQPLKTLLLQHRA